MANTTDIIIIALALLAVVGAILLVRPLGSHNKSGQMQRLVNGAEHDLQRVGDMLDAIQHRANEADQLNRELSERLQKISQDQQKSCHLADDFERTVKRARSAETELRNISHQLDERIQYVRTYWDDQLQQTVKAARAVRGQLSDSLDLVGNGLQRLREQERMAQGFMNKLLDYQKIQFSAQKENVRLATEVNARLEGMLNESARSLLDIQTQQRNSSELFASFSAEIQAMEQAAKSNFVAMADSSIEVAEQAEKNLEQMRTYLGNTQQAVADSTLMVEQIRSRFDQVKDLQVDRLTQTIDITDEMCTDLQTGLENAHQLLLMLEQKTAQVIDPASWDDQPNTPAALPQKQQNLFSLNAYRGVAS